MKPRLLWLLALVMCVHFSALAQSRYSATFREASAEEAIQILKKSTGYDFVYQKELLKDNGATVNGTFTDTTLDDLLSATVNRQLGLSYKVLGNSVSLSEDTSVAAVPVSTITGTVTGEDGEPLPGVTILLKSNPKHGTSTDIDGRYNFPIPKGTKSPVLVYSFVGMEPKELAVRKSSTMNVTLRENPETLHDVVVTGIFRRNKELATGASTTLSAKELKQVGNQNLLQSLRTLDPSIKLVDNNLAGSNPNALPEVELRGANGITDLDANYTGNPNQPLFILDGFETTLQRVMDMDPNRVASITILKDASAAALYGSRSANGVIVIETLAPEGGRIRVNYAGDYAVVTPDLSDYDMLSAREKLQLQVDAGHFDATDNTNYNILQDYYQRLKRNVEEGVNTDWLAQPVHTVFEHRHNVRLEGGDNTVRYSINLTARNAPGVMKGSGRTGYEGGMFLSYRVKGLIFKNDLQLTYNDADNSPYGKFSTYVAMNPYQRPTDADGRLVKQFDKDAPRYFTGYNNNPLYDAGLNITDSEDYFNFVNNFSLEWNITDFLTLMARVSITRQTGETNYFLPAQHSSFAEMGDPVTDPEEYMRRGSFTWGTSKMFSVLGDINLRYGQSFGKHSLYAVMGVNVSQTTAETRTVRAEGFPSQNMVDISFAKQYYKDSRPTSTYNINRLAGILLTANYAYDSKYLLDASLKYDGSSQFGANQRYAPVWSVGAGWNIHKEAFLEGGVFSQLKLRGSYGVTAAQNFSPYQAICRYQYNIAHQYAGIIPATMMGLGNNDLKWQQTKVINGGTDIGLFNDRLSFTFDIYKRRTTNLLASVTVAPSLGFPSYTENIGETENNGYEFSLRYMFLRDVSRRLYWSVNFSGNHNSNKITKISNAMKKRNEDIIDKAYREGTTTPLLLYEEGNSVTSIYAVRSLGIDPSNGQEMYLTKNGIKTYTWNSADQVCVGDTRPDMEGVFGTSINWGDFSFSANFRYSFGGQVYNTTLADRVENANLYQNVDRRVYDQRWRKPGDVTMFKDVKDTSRTRQTSRFVQDNDYISCESISLGYDITSRKVLGFIGAERLRVTGYLNDIFRWSTVKQERGLDYPFARRYAFSLNVSF